MSEESKFQCLSHWMTVSSDTPLHIPLPYLECHQVGIMGGSVFRVPGTMPRVPINACSYPSPWITITDLETNFRRNNTLQMPGGGLFCLIRVPEVMDEILTVSNPLSNAVTFLDLNPSVPLGFFTCSEQSFHLLRKRAFTNHI